MKKPNPDPMHASPRCSAKSKRSGIRCKSPAVKGKTVCRMHGAHGGGPKGPKNGSWKHGAYEREFVQQTKAARLLHKLFAEISS